MMNEIKDVETKYLDGIVDITEDMLWMSKDMIKRGGEIYQSFIDDVCKCPSCKKYIPQNDSKYEDCMIQKWNNAYENNLYK